jgi:hypothetical protein
MKASKVIFFMLGTFSAIFRRDRIAILDLIAQLTFHTKRIYRRDILVVSPEIPERPYTLWKLAAFSGVRMVGLSEWKPDEQNPTAFIRHKDVTWDEEVDPKFINGFCADISKTTLDGVFEEVFGYCTRLDPTKHQGLAVMKSEANSSVKGKFIECPLTPEAVDRDFIYQRLIDNEMTQGMAREYRVAVVGCRVTDVVVTDRNIENRLYGAGSDGEFNMTVVKPESLFSADELSKIGEFCERFGLEVGEMDILPDAKAGRIYILDANKTSTSFIQPSAVRISRILMMMKRAELFYRYIKSNQRDRIRPDSRETAESSGISTV